MKVRVGFVSNSSSSSFIIALTEAGKKAGSETCPCCKRPFENDPIATLNGLKNNWGDDEDAVNFVDAEGLWPKEAFVTDERAVRGDDGTYEFQGKTYKEDELYVVEVSYHNNERHDYLTNSGYFEVVTNMG